MDYNFIISPENILGDIVTVDYKNQPVGVYSGMSQILTAGSGGTSTLTGLSVNILITQTAVDAGYYSPFDGAILQKDVVANFINLNSSIWSNEDLELLRNLNKSNNVKNDKYSVYYTNNWIKNTQGNLKYCAENKLSVHILKENRNRIEFLKDLSKFKTSSGNLYPLLISFLTNSI